MILLGRLDHANVGPYAAISVASKALVFGALALGAYLLPEATIRWNEGGHAVRQLGVTLIFLAVPAGTLLRIAVFIPRWFLTVVFGAKLSSAAPAFATLVVAMMFLSFSVLVTNYLFGTGSRWIVLLLAAGSGLALALVGQAHGQTVATARADLLAQAVAGLGHGRGLCGHPPQAPGPAPGVASVVPAPTGCTAWWDLWRGVSSVARRARRYTDHRHRWQGARRQRAVGGIPGMRRVTGELKPLVAVGAGPESGVVRTQWSRPDAARRGRGRGSLWTAGPGAGSGAPTDGRRPPSGRAGPLRSARPASEVRHDQSRLPRSLDCHIGEIAERAGLKRIDVVAWRDFDDPEAGGSELHAHRVMSAWSKAGLDVSMTTSSVPDARTVIRRDGYRVIRRAGRYSVFPRTMLSGALGRIGAGDGLVEIWNGMPFFSPLWAHCPHIVFLHHVHAEMWKMVLPTGMAECGYAIEHRLAPPVYRRSRIVTLSTSSKTGDRRTPAHPPRAGVGVAARRRTPVLSRRRALGGPVGGGGGPLGTGQAVPPVDRGAGGHQADTSPAAGGHRRRGLRATGPRGPDPPIGGRVMDLPAGLCLRAGADRPLPARLGGGVHFAPRGVGNDGDRGRGVRHALGGHPDRRPRGRGGRRADGDPGRRSR